MRTKGVTPHARCGAALPSSRTFLEKMRFQIEKNLKLHWHKSGTPVGKYRENRE